MIMKITEEIRQIQHRMVNLNNFIKKCFNKRYFIENIASSFKTSFGNPNKFSSIMNYIHFQVYEDNYNVYDIITTLLEDGIYVVRYYEKYYQNVDDWCQDLADELIKNLDNFISINKDLIISLYKPLYKYVDNSEDLKYEEPDLF